MKALSHQARTRAACAPRARASLIKGLSLKGFYLHRYQLTGAPSAPRRGLELRKLSC